MKKNNLNIIIFILLLIAPVFSQNATRISGRVVDKKTQLPLEAANIQLAGTSYFTTTDNDGFFTFSRIPNGIYTLTLQMVGYSDHKQIIKVDDFAEIRLNVALSPKMYSLPIQIVMAEKPGLTVTNGQLTQSFKIDSLPGAGANLENLLKTVPGITVIKTSSGKHTVQIAGAESKHVKILLDGTDISNPQTGEVYLNIISPENISRIEFIEGGSAQYGSGAMGGAINIVTKSLKGRYFSVNTSVTEFQRNRYGNGIRSTRVLKGDVDTYKHSLTGGVNLGKKVYWYQSFSMESAQNKFRYPYEGALFLRENSGFIQRRYFSKFSLTDPFGRLRKLSIQINYNDDDIHMPGRFYHLEPLINASAEEKTLILNNNTEFILPWFLTVRSTNAFRKFNHLLNGENEPFFFIRFKSENMNKIWETSHSVQRNFWQNRYFIEAGFSYRLEKVHMTDLLYPQRSMGKHQREMMTVTFQNSWQYQFRYVMLNASYMQRLEKYHDQKWMGFPSTAAKISVVNNLHIVSIFGQFSRGFKYPDLNSLFWIPTARARGNPDLKPEQSKNSKAGLEWNVIPLRSRFQVSVYQDRVYDYILWQEGLEGWKPVNISETKISGYQLTMAFKPFSFLKTQADYYQQDPLNKSREKTQVNYYNKELPFLFTSQIKGNLQLNFNGYFGTLFYQKNSPRKSNPYNTPGNEIPGFAIWDANIGKQFRFTYVVFKITFEINNIYNEDYSLLKGYPMPGRHYRLNLNLSTP